MSEALEIDVVSMSFGGVIAVNQVSCHARKGEILSIIGPNGAGKTTLFNVISGFNRPTGGRVRLSGVNVTGLPPHRLAHLGVSRTFQNLQIFFHLSVLENVMIGRTRWERTSCLADMLGLPSVARQNAETRRAAYEVLERMNFAEQAQLPAASLPYGSLKRLEIARALASEPAVLLLDEPAAGCNATETEQIAQLIRSIASNDVAIVLIEHDMKMVMNLSTNVVVLNGGRKLAEGPPAAVRCDPEVIAAYLGAQKTTEAGHVEG